MAVKVSPVLKVGVSRVALSSGSRVKPRTVEIGSVMAVRVMAVMFRLFELRMSGWLLLCWVSAVTDGLVQSNPV